MTIAKKENEELLQKPTFTYTETYRFENEEQKQEYLKREKRLKDLIQIFTLNILDDKSIKH